MDDCRCGALQCLRQIYATWPMHGMSEEFERRIKSVIGDDAIQNGAAATAQDSTVEDARDAARFRFWFSPDAKTIDVHEYSRGVTLKWSLDHWRGFVDTAMAKEKT